MINSKCIIRCGHFHPGGTIIHSPHHPAHCGQCRQNDDPFDKIRQFFIEDPSNPFYTLFYIFRFYSGLQSFRAHLSSSSACWLSSCFTHAPRAAAPSPVLPASAKQARSESVRLCQGEKPSGAMWAPRRSPARQSFRWAATACPETPCPPGSRPKQSRSPRTQTRGHRHGPREP